MWFMLTTRNNKDLLMLKVLVIKFKDFFNFSYNFFFYRMVCLIVFTPISSIMTKYYENEI